MILALPALAVAVLNYIVIPHVPEATDATSGRAMPVARTPFSHLLRQRALWFLALAYFFFNFGYWGYLGWMPSYLAAAHHIDLKTVGMAAGIPYVRGGRENSGMSLSGFSA